MATCKEGFVEFFLELCTLLQGNNYFVVDLLEIDMKLVIKLPFLPLDPVVVASLLKRVDEDPRGVLEQQRRVGQGER